MAIIEWNESLSVKIDLIDAQHKELFNLINNFYEKIKNQSSNELLDPMVKALREYTFFHFSSEEKLMKQYGFPGYHEHKIEHDMFIEKVSSFEEKLSSGKLIVSFEITSFIKDWITRHIKNTDKKYSDFLIQRGVK